MGTKKLERKSQPQQKVEVYYNETYKIMFDGSLKTGKISLITKFLQDKHYERKDTNYLTRPYSIFKYGFSMEGKNICIEIYDCISNDIFGGAGIYISRRIDVFIFVYSIEDKATFVSTKKNLPKFKDKFEEKDALLILVGNKLDLPKREVYRKDAE